MNTEQNSFYLFIYYLFSFYFYLFSCIILKFMDLPGVSQLHNKKMPSQLLVLPQASEPVVSLDDITIG